MEGEATTVLVVDDHTVFAEALALAVDGTGDLRGVGTASTLGGALSMVDALEPDVCVLDLGLPDADGADAVSCLRRRRPDLRVLVLTGRPDLAVMRGSVEAGASGFLLKDAPMATVLDAIRNLPCEATLVQRSVLLAVLGDRGAAGAARLRGDGLSPRDLDVLRLLATGLPPKAIAARLGIAVSTCRGYVKRLLTKLGAHSQLEAVSIARRDKLIE